MVLQTFQVKLLSACRWKLFFRKLGVVPLVLHVSLYLNRAVQQGNHVVIGCYVCLFELFYGILDQNISCANQSFIYSNFSLAAWIMEF